MIEVNGTVTVVPETPTLAIIHKVLHCDLMTTINLKEDQVLLVDDTGARKGLPVNREASKLVSDRLGRLVEIYGDAVLANDRDF